MRKALLVVGLMGSPWATAAGGVQQCGPGDYADYCGRPPPALTVRIPVKEFAERTRGRKCPAQYIRISAYGNVFCEVPSVDGGVVTAKRDESEEQK